MADRAAVRTAYKYFVLDFYQFPFKVPSSECPMIVKVFVFSYFPQSGETPEIKVHRSCEIHFFRAGHVCELSLYKCKNQNCTEDISYC